MATLPPAAAALVDRPVLAAFTTLRPSGAPHTTPVWIAREGDELLVNTAKGRVKARNVEHDPRVSVCLVDPDDPMNALAVEGTVVEVTTDGRRRAHRRPQPQVHGQRDVRRARARPGAAHLADPVRPRPSALGPRRSARSTNRA